MKALQMSEESYLALPDGPPWYEWRHGTAIEITPAHGRHGLAVKGLARWFGAIEQAYQGTLYIDTRLDIPGVHYYPDLVFVQAGDAACYDAESGRITGTPHLAIEIVSESSASRDRVDKLNDYLTAGVGWYWIVDPVAGTIEEFCAGPSGPIRTDAAHSGQPFRPHAFPGETLSFSLLTH